MSKAKKGNYDAIVIGASAGGLDALAVLLPSLKPDLRLPVMVVLHISPNSDSFLVTYLNQMSGIRVTEAADKELLQPGTVYFAPPNYHLMVEDRRTLALTNEDKVNFSRPSIDILFETAVWTFGSRIIGIILTGANWDGARGMELIQAAGGYTIVQNPAQAVVARMPESVIERIRPDKVLPVEAMGPLLNELAG